MTLGSSFMRVLATAEPMLIAVVALLVLVILAMIGMAFVVRRRSRLIELAAARARNTPVPPAVAAPPPRPRTRPRRSHRRWRWRTCRRDLDGDDLPDVPHRISRHDVLHARRAPPRAARGHARRSAPRSGRSQQVGRPRVHGVVAARTSPVFAAARTTVTSSCRFPSTTRRAPRRRGATEPANVIARICPVCATKYDLNARFCGHDAGELVVIN